MKTPAFAQATETAAPNVQPHAVTGVINVAESSDPDVLAAALEEAKEREAAAAQYRKQIEEHIVTTLGCKEEGSSSFKGERYKLVTVGKINRSVDIEKLQEIWEQLPDTARSVLRYKPEVVKKEFDAIQKYQPEVYQLIAQAVTEKPGKPQVTFKRIED